MLAKIDILLATYNGEKFLNEQLESIFMQDFQDFRIIVRDDGSTDHTLDILSKWKGLYPQKIDIVQDDLKNLGPTQNFNQLLQYAEAPYICFSDQDDKWLPSKLSKQLEFIQSIEEEHPNKGVMVFSDLILCDENLEIISTSLIEKDRLDTRAVSTNRLLMQNVPYGCAIMINHKLLKQIFPIDQRALLHDHWAAIISATIGEIQYLDEALIYHRIHQKNASRAESEHKKEASQAISKKITNQNFHNYLNKQVAQAQAILDHLEPHLDEKQKKIFNDFISLQSRRGVSRKWIIVKNRFFKNTIYHTIKLILRA